MAARRRTNLGSLQRQLRGDLDWIALKALEKDRTRRYPSASELAADVARHLADEPVVARPPSTGYRLRKFVRKHRVPVAAGSVAVAAVVLLGASLAWFGVRSQQQALLVHASSILTSAASVVDDDPLLAALLVAELPDSLQSPERVGVLREIANHPLPLAELRAPGAAFYSVAFSPDGSLVAGGPQSAPGASVIGDVYVWRSDGTGPRVVLSHPHNVSLVAFSPDGALLLTVARDAVRLWDPSGQRAPIVLAGGAIDASFSPDGSQVLAVGRQAVRLWSSDGTEELVVLDDAPWVFGAVFSEDGTKVVVAFARRQPSALSPARGLTVRFWTRDGFVEEIDVSDTELWGAILSATGERVLATLGDGRGCGIWQTDGHEEPTLHHLEEDVHCAVFSPDGKFGAAIRDPSTLDRDFTCVDCPVWVFGADRDGEPVRLQSPATVFGARFSPDGAYLLGKSITSARLWRTDGLGEAVVFQQSGLASAFSADGRFFATTSFDGINGTVYVWHTRRLLEGLALRGHDGAVNSAAFSPDGVHVATASDDATVRAWSLANPGRPIVLPHSEPVNTVQFSPDGRQVLSASEDGVVRVWDIDERREVAAFANPRPFSTWAVRSAAFSPDGRTIITAAPNAVRLWSIDAGAEPTALDMRGATGAVFSPDGNLIAASTRDSTRVWKADDLEGAPLVLQGSGGPGVAFDPTSTRLMTVSPSDLMVRVFDLDSPEDPRVVPLLGAGSSTSDYFAYLIPAPSFDPTGRLMATSFGATVRLWWADSGASAMTLRGHGLVQPRVLSLAFSPDGNKIVTAGDNGEARVWTVGLSGLMDYLRTATTACLAPSQREEHLGESPEEVWSAYAACERKHDRPVGPPARGE